jgi:hypothetical protein
MTRTHAQLTVDHDAYAVIGEKFRGAAVRFRDEQWYIHHWHEGKVNLFHPTSRHAFLNVPSGDVVIVTLKAINVPRSLGNDEWGIPAQEPRGSYAVGTCVVCGARTKGTRGNGAPKTCSRCAQPGGIVECFKALPR